MAPRRSWNGAAYVVSLAADVTNRNWSLANGGMATIRAGSRGQLIAISEGPGQAGYLICDWCGWGAPYRQRIPTSHTPSASRSRAHWAVAAASLAHPYETDILEITFDRLGAPRTDLLRWRSALYALLEGASERLDISRDDIDGTLYPKIGGQTALIIFDSVPGGAGGAVRIAESFPEVVQAAHQRVSECDCGEETSCYGCLRGYRNQAYHEELQRGDAIRFLAPLLSLA